MVYVDPMSYHGMRMYNRFVESCHLFADDISELIDFGRKIDLKYEWIHTSRRGLKHFDLTCSKRLQAIKCGAIELSRKEFYEIIKKAKMVN